MGGPVRTGARAAARQPDRGDGGRRHRGLPAGVQPGQDYDIFAGSVIGYVEVDLGVVRPFLLGVYGSADGDPRDRQLRGFAVQPQDDSTQWATGMLAHFDKSLAAGTRDSSCPARLRGVRSRQMGCRATPMPLARMSRRRGSAEWALRSVTIPSRTCGMRAWGARSHQGIVTTYSNPGTLLGSVGARTFPLKGHEITGWYVYRAMLDTSLLETAFAPEIQAGVIRQIRKALYHEIGGFWMWTLNPHFDIRLAGNVAKAAMGAETWRTWPTVTRDRPAGPVKVKPWR